MMESFQAQARHKKRGRIPPLSVRLSSEKIALRKTSGWIIKPEVTNIDLNPKHFLQKIVYLGSHVQKPFVLLQQPSHVHRVLVP